jgi:hypothetical protein
MQLGFFPIFCVYKIRDEPTDDEEFVQVSKNYVAVYIAAAPGFFCLGGLSPPRNFTTDTETKKCLKKYTG